MGKIKPLSAVMVAALDMADANGGKLVRYQGGYWAPEGAGHPMDRKDGEYVGTPTVEALAARGRMTYTRWTTGRRGQFPTQAEVVRDANVAEHPAVADAISQPGALR